MRFVVFVLFAGAFAALGGQAQQADSKTASPSVEEAVKGTEKHPGYFTFYWDARKGRILLEVDKWDAEFLYVNWMATGIGSNDIGLDRGQIGDSRIVIFRRSGPKVLLVQPNFNYRADSDNPEERRAVREAFAESVLGGFEVEAEDKDGRALVDATKFFLRDARDVVAVLKNMQQGSFTLDAARSAIYLPGTRNFPRNTEVEATLTFAGDHPGSFLDQVVPAPTAISMRQHHSWIQLPDRHYRPRAFDPRSGYIFTRYVDFAAPLSEPLEKSLIIRHRLHKPDGVGVSAPDKPLIYYVDPGTPEPIRTALVEGAGWWNQAFEAAGYKDAFRVEILPAGADPMDVRYNVIQWVHRATRGWAYGSAVVDPRTGEIIKGHVSMDSQRARQVHRIAEALLASYEEGKPANPEIERMVLARIRQLAAHEVGHTLGLAHNFAASARGRASVMDYPHPLVELRNDGGLDVSNAYATGIGAWDKVAIDYGYRQFPAGTVEKEQLDRILVNAAARGLVLLTDQDARPDRGSATHPLAHLWDNGPNAVDELERVLRVRARALARFSEKNLRFGQPWSTLEDQLVLIYLFHRYQTEAAVKLVGGLDYTHALREDGQQPTASIPPAEQRRALAAALRTLDPEILTLPEAILKLLPPRAYGYEATRELFPKRTQPAFDAIGTAEAAASGTVRLLLDPARAARLIEHHGRDPQAPSLGEVVDKLVDSTWKAPRQSGPAADVQRVVEDVLLYHLMALASDDKAADQVRAVADLKIAELKKWLKEQRPADENQHAHVHFAMSRIENFEKKPEQPTLSKPLELPPGQPIGTPAEGCGG